MNTGVNQAGTATRTVTQGPAAINCAPLADSRCGGTAATPGALPSCTVTPNPMSLEMGNAATVAATISANCSSGVTAYEWTATNGTTPAGQQQSLTYYNPGTYCYTVAGRNPSANLNFGAASPQACVTVTRTAQNTQCSGASALPWNTSNAGWGAVVNGSYSTCSSGPTNQAGYQYYLLDTTAMNSSTCPWDGPYSQSMSCSSCGFGTTWNGSSCQIDIPTCTGGRSWNGAACVCTENQIWNNTTHTCENPPPVCTLTNDSGPMPCPTGYGTYTITRTVNANCTGYIWSDNSNICTTAPCTGGRTWNAGTMACECGPGQTFNTTFQICQANTPTCTGGRSWDAVAGACVCTGGQTWNSTTQACETPIVCTGGRTWNGSACVCSGTDTWNGFMCVPRTPDCVSPMQIINGSCQCPLSTNGTSACPPPTTGTYTFSTSYSGPTCSPNTISNQSSACVDPPPVVCYSWQYTYTFATQDHTLSAITRNNNPPVMQGYDGSYYQLYLVGTFLSGQGGNTTC
jgi:hypothetical protein